MATLVMESWLEECTIEMKKLLAEIAEVGDAAVRGDTSQFESLARSCELLSTFAMDVHTDLKGK